MRTEIIIGIIMALFISACGQAPAQINSTPIISDEACEVRDSCTYPLNIPGYFCNTIRWDPTAGAGAKLAPSFFGKDPCVITKEDYRYAPDCDPSKPNSVCSGAWGIGESYPCCNTVQGPGPAAILN